MGGKGGAAQAPDYSQVAAANEAAARIQADVAREQLAWAKEQYASDREITSKVLDTMLPQLESAATAAIADRARYEQTFQPQEDKLVADAEAYASAEKQQQEAGRAAALVAQSFENARQAAVANLENYGVDPSMVRGGALDLGTRIAEAAATAGAANQARLATENTGRALRGEAINIGKGYPAQVATAQGIATQTGQAAVGSNLATTASGAQTMGTGVQWSGLQNQALGNWTALASSANRAGDRSGGAGWGQAVGGALSLARSFIPI